MVNQKYKKTEIYLPVREKKTKKLSVIKCGYIPQACSIV